MDFKIVLLSQDKTQTHNLDMYGDTDINIVFNIVDVRDPQNIKSNYTKEIIIPATKANNKFFEGMLYNGFYPNKFNPNLKVSCQLYGDSTIIIDGYLQIVDVVKNQNSIDAYKIIIYGEIASVFNSLNGLELRTLDISEYNHIWNYTNEINSWDNKIVYNGNIIQSILGKGYVYPFEFRGQSTTDMSVEDFFPSIYVKTLWDKIFNKAGKTYTSKFLNSEKFSRLILPYVKSHIYLSEEEVKKRQFKAHSSTNRLLNSLPATVAQTSANQKMQYNIEDSDPDNIYNNVSIYKPNHKQEVTLASLLKLRMTYAPSIGAGVPYYILGGNITGVVKLFDMTIGSMIYSENFEFVHNVGANLGPVSVDIDVFMDYKFLSLAGHKYEVYVDWTIPVGATASKFSTILGAPVGGNMFLTQLANSTYYNNLEAKYIFEGDNIDMNQIIPDGVSITDFLTSINKLFNLYWVPNGDTDFIIEPRDDMYSNPDLKIHDWTEKTDRNLEILMTPMAELNNKEYYFHYTEDKDYYNETYTNSTGEIYGERRIVVMNDFVTDKSEVDVIFSPSPLVKVKNSLRVAPAYVLQKDGFFESVEVKIRIAIYGGKKDSSSAYWLFKSNDYPKGTMQYIYPYAGHLDDPYNPTYDINYGKCKEYYYDWVNMPTNNLFNQYWRNSITDIIAPDSHMWKGTLHLRTYDMLTLNIFDTIEMDEVYYKINNINYNPLTETAYVELFKTTTFARNANTLSVYTPPITVTSPTGTGTFHPWLGGTFTPWIADGTWTPLPLPWKNALPAFGLKDEIALFNISRSTDMSSNKVKQDTSYGIGTLTLQDIHQNIFDRGSFVEISGKLNNVASLSVGIKIMGDRNNVGKSATNISIVGNDNVVLAGLKNVSIVGDNVIARTSNTSYINGTIIKNGSLFEEFTIINGSINEVQNPFSSAVTPNLIKGSINCVQNIGGMSRINLVTGGGDTVQNPFD